MDCQTEIRRSERQGEGIKLRANCLANPQASRDYFVSGYNKQPTQRMETATSTYHMAPSTGSSDLCQELLDHRDSFPLTAPMSTPLAVAQIPLSFSKPQCRFPTGKPTPSSPDYLEPENHLMDREAFGSFIGGSRGKQTEKRVHHTQIETSPLAPTRLQCCMQVCISLIVGLRVALVG